MSNNNPLTRFIGKVLSKSFTNKATNEPFNKLSILIDNPEPQVKGEDGIAKANTYNKGQLIWFDNETGGQFLVKQIDVTNVGEDAAKKGFTNSLKITLDDTYHVRKLN